MASAADGRGCGDRRKNLTTQQSSPTYKPPERLAGRVESPDACALVPIGLVWRERPFLERGAPAVLSKSENP